MYALRSIAHIQTCSFTHIINNHIPKCDRTRYTFYFALFVCTSSVAIRIVSLSMSLSVCVCVHDNVCMELSILVYLYIVIFICIINIQRYFRAHTLFVLLDHQQCCLVWLFHVFIWLNVHFEQTTIIATIIKVIII